MSEARIVTFGCRLNVYESEVMRAKIDESGLKDAIVFNTCAVTAEATRQARQAIRKARRDNPHARIIVTGCAAQIDPQSFAQMSEVDLVLGNEEKLKAESFGDAFGLGDEERVRVNDIMSVRETAAHMLDAFSERTRAFVQIQNGCDHRCTFCVIPFGRGNSRSVPAGEAVEQVRRLVANGYGEIVLSGVDITSWGNDLPGKPKLGNLVRRMLKLVPDLKRLRLSSIDSIEADEELVSSLCRRRAPDAACASVAAVGRRHDPQAHEAAPFAPGFDCLLREAAGAAARYHFRRRHHRRLSDRDRSDVRQFAETRR